MTKKIITDVKNNSMALNEWYRGENVNYHPAKRLRATESAIEEFILDGWLSSKTYFLPLVPTEILNSFLI